MRLPLVLVALAIAPEALAGGIGVIGTVGMRSDPVYFYDSSNDFAQYRETQTLPSYGTGLEFVLGDRDDRITGIFRGYWLQDTPQQTPTSESVKSEDLVANVRDTPRNMGVGTFGVQWGIVGSPDKFMLTLLTSAGSGFLTNDHTEYLLLQGGVGGTYRVARDVQAFVEVDYNMRYRKGFTQGGGMYLGARYLFD